MAGRGRKHATDGELVAATDQHRLEAHGDLDDVPDSELELYSLPHALAELRGDPSVLLHAGTEREQRIPVFGRLVIGRQCSGVEERHRLVLDDPTVSRHHLEIRAEPDLGGIYAFDVSANGTHLNGARLERAKLVPLNAGDRLQLGDVELVVQAEAQLATGRSAARTTARRFVHGPMAMVVGDIVGYSTIAQANDSATLTHALDHLFGELRALLRTYGGMLANYAGDAFFAAWELNTIPDAGERAVAFAVQASELVRQIAPTLALKRPDRQELRMGWGVALGEGTVSVLTGSLTTVVGESANLAFRLSGLAAREQRGEVLVLADAAQSVGDSFAFGEAQALELKGRSEAVRVCAPVVASVV